MASAYGETIIPSSLLSHWVNSLNPIVTSGMDSGGNRWKRTWNWGSDFQHWWTAVEGLGTLWIWMSRVQIPSVTLRRKATKTPLAEAFYAYPGECRVRLPNDGTVEWFHSSTQGTRTVSRSS